MPKVKVNHSGNCTHPDTGVTHHYIVDEAVELPDEVLEAIGEENYEVAEGNTEEKLSYKDLQARAKELDLPTNKKYDDLAALIAEREKEIEGNTEEK